MYTLEIAKIVLPHSDAADDASLCSIPGSKPASIVAPVQDDCTAVVGSGAALEEQQAV